VKSGKERKRDVTKRNDAWRKKERSDREGAFTAACAHGASFCANRATTEGRKTRGKVREARREGAFDDEKRKGDLSRRA